MGYVPRADLGRCAQEVLHALPETKETAVLVALVGELGAGKTTFVQVVGKELGVVEPIQSPTYVLMKSYPIHFGQYTKLIHIDAYRLSTPEEFLALKPEAFLHDPHNLIMIEWPERVKGHLPPPDVEVYLSSEGALEGERYFEYK